jgi:cation transport regulator ChaC
MVARVPSARFVGVGKLSGYALRFHKRSRDGSAKANALATEILTDQVWGVVYEISNREIGRLDKAEGQGYHRCELQVSMGKTGLVSALVYIAHRDAIDGGLKAYAWYKRLVVEGARKHGLPLSYVESLEAIEAVEDPDSARDRKEQAQVC